MGVTKKDTGSLVCSSSDYTGYDSSSEEILRDERANRLPLVSQG